MPASSRLRLGCVRRQEQAKKQATKKSQGEQWSQSVFRMRLHPKKTIWADDTTGLRSRSPEAVATPKSARGDGNFRARPCERLVFAQDGPASFLIRTASGGGVSGTFITLWKGNPVRRITKLETKMIEDGINTLRANDYA